MLIALAAITLAATLMILVLLSFLLISIHREDRAPELACRPPTRVTALIRHLCGLHVRSPPTSGPADHARQGGRLTPGGIRRSSGEAA